MTGQKRYASRFLTHCYRALSRAKQSERGTVAVIFALSAIPLVGMTSLSIEYSRASNMRAAMQQYADASALNATVWRKNNREAEAAGDRDAYANYDAWAGMHETLKQFQDNYPGQISRIAVGATWVGDDQFQLTLEVVMPPKTFSMFGDMTVGISTVARVIEYQKPQPAPKVVFLDFEAADYNRLYVYCFEKDDATKPASQQKPAAQRRREFTPISDNGGTTYDIKMPACTPQESLSIMLHNVTDARLNRSQWETNPKLHYSDTDDKNHQAAQTYNFGGINMVETIVCDTLAQCKTKPQGGIIPVGKNRNPAPNTKVCSPGKYIYHGFEDRPPTNGDRDYDDITMVMECPRVEIGTRVILAR